MKVTNIFKKANKSTANANIQTLDKKQLEKVIGGTDTVIDTTITDPTTTDTDEARAGKCKYKNITL